MRFTNVCLHAFGYELPPRVVRSEELEHRLAPVYKRLKLPEGRLEGMSGIRERRFWEPGTKPSAVAARAGAKALAASNVSPSAIDCLIFTSVSRDMLEPASASFVHQQLGLPDHCLVFDLSNACLGFLNGMVLAANLIESGQIRQALIVAGETAEDLVESTIRHLLTDESLTRKSIKDSFASLTIGSGAVALAMGGCDSPRTGIRLSLAGAVWLADTSHSNLCQGGAAGSQGTLMATDSEELLKRGVALARRTWDAFLAELDWSADSIGRVFCHQVGSAHARNLLNAISAKPEKNFESLPFLGNVGSVSAPITLAMGIEQKLLANDQRIAVLGIGSGINCMMLGIFCHSPRA